MVALWGGSRGWLLAACRMRARTRGWPLWACAAALKCPLAGLFHLGAGPARAARWRAPVLWICAESHAPRTALAGHVQLGPVVCPRKAPQIPQPAPYSQPPQTRSMPCCLESWAGAAVRTLRVGGWFCRCVGNMRKRAPDWPQHTAKSAGIALESGGRRDKAPQATARTSPSPLCT